MTAAALAQTATATCTYPLVGVDAALEHLRRLAAELLEVGRLRAVTFSWAATVRERELAAELAAKTSLLSIVTGKPEADLAARLAA